MSKVLYIKANIKNEGESRTFKVSDSFVEEYKKNNPEDQIITLDLYKENIDFLRADDLGKLFGPKDEESKNNSILKYAYQFADADKYIIAAPMWNLSFPAILKAYIDYVSVSGITFKYTAEGPVGLLNNKKAVHIVSRGGGYDNSPYEMGDRYLRTILGFFGIKDIETIDIDNLDVIGVNVKEKVKEGIEKAISLAKKF
ncbi:NAD(P)H-dependent oxidoreductase [Clostridium perfringens]|uniref:FMN-dependent NADH:quinone oxidoreductase n=1 Tax=Clostridium perfringens (strain SM101 / Type A) TaxID=289380 RepID=AZOR_CLOPS|nr:FMN-dependent NADH-azoreductase [Clostridium perfringens]Q0SUV5.1 RecName: Full=FMN-dependent NADH:quinone oxidoreductase; AltName: Full=Azo-dye reductase; AltName: Full=FMN-dependent NADH-azo compound oxidoreductase; AltName: Full=FMN-dependent NADH-azoreductase [Clostridium perfringens SM101]ABG87852.1 flavodoxin family protein [Clostridium perfringens SM101]EJT5917983.1 FMN-dependent NADH-azoreductase [Clostridium perfringens]EJT5940626.1 FMN-dependent NADH-azoreductase [Clostridium perfr